MPADKRDLTTEAGARAFLQAMKDHARERFLADKDLAPQAVMIETRDPETGKAHAEPKLAYFFVTDDIINDHGATGGKGKLAIMLRARARRSFAIGFCWMSEAWMVYSEKPGQTPAGSWENVPGRKETLYLTYQHKALGGNPTMTAAEIIRKGKAVTVGPWSPDSPSEGKFSGILPPDDYEQKERAAMEGLIASGVDLTPGQRRYHINRAKDRLRQAGFPPAAVDEHERYMTGYLREHGQEIADEEETP